jgi:potassium voltage-gated channel Eag-related subfamily H protein 8
MFGAGAGTSVRQSKRQSWQSYVSNINSNAPVGKVWDAVRKMGGKYEKGPTVHMEAGDGQCAGTETDIAGTLAEAFEGGSSSGSYSDEFQQHKGKAEKEHISFASANDEDCNSLFSIDDFFYSIKTASDSAAGPDEVYYQFLKHLPP